MSENHDLKIGHSLYDLYHMNMPSKEEQCNEEDDYRRGFYHGVIESINLITKININGYVRPKEIVNILEHWAYSDLINWRYSAFKDYEKTQDWCFKHPVLEVENWHEKKKRIFARDNYSCVYCGSEFQLQLDHIVSVKNGGGIDDDNLQTLCKRCNIEKGSK